jgi:hypothetical protein
MTGIPVRTGLTHDSSVCNSQKSTGRSREISRPAPGMRLLDFADFCPRRPTEPDPSLLFTSRKRRIWNRNQRRETLRGDECDIHITGTCRANRFVNDVLGLKEDRPRWMIGHAAIGAILCQAAALDDDGNGTWMCVPSSVAARLKLELSHQDVGRSTYRG